MDAGLRDLVDLDDLLRHWGTREVFWEELLQRARQQDLVQPLCYALRYCSRLLGTPVPPQLQAKSVVYAGLPPGALSLMDRLVMTALDPSRDNLDSRRAGFGRWLLYLRSHKLRMPMHLLLPHLLRKAAGSD